MRRAAEAGYHLYDAGDGVVQVACDETTTPAHLRDVVAALVGAARVGSGLDSGDVALVPADEDAIPAALVRTSKFLTHPVFSAHRSETAMLRYLRRLSDLDVALDRSMIPLGSCTMKLNAAAEMEAITWPEFAGLHPLAPAGDAAGYLELIGDLEAWLCAITGYDACSLQPNAGSQGELAGLLAIRGYHQSRGEGERDVCLIPESAHGTNAASAVLAGLRVAVVKCGADGAISLDGLRSALAAHDGRVAAIMVTYPSTNGVYETTITEVCDLVHEAGGQVYIDGANLNALAGLASPALLGGDVSHLNLHKTFCIPHGGGGPGVGPVAARAHLAPFLPGASEAGPVAAARYGSAGVLPISWAYIAMMGAAGLRRATQVAVLSANYVARRLTPYFPVLHAGRDGLVAHECIVDLRRLPGGITVEDVAKRLIDYGFHAPTMSFPVAGTFMIEPTESESLAEIDEFCDAMISIKAEIDKVASGERDATDNPLKNAPHTAEMLIAGEWKHPYPPAEGGYPGPAGRQASRHAAGRSTGPRCAASTRRTATATSSAPARPRKPSSSLLIGRGSRCYTSGNRDLIAADPACWGEKPLGGGGGGTTAGVPGSPRPPREAGAGSWVIRSGSLLDGYRETEQVCQVTGQLHDDAALRFRWVGARDDGDRGHVPPVHRQVRRPRRDVHKVPGTYHGPLDQAVPVPDLGLAADGVDRGLVPVVEVRHAAAARRDHDQVEAQALGAGGLAGDPGREADALRAAETVGTAS